MSETHAVSQNASIWRAHTPRGARGWRAHTRTLRRGIAHAGGAGDTARGQERNPNSRAVACNDANPGLLFRAPPVPIAVLRRGGKILAFSALAWVVAHAVYAPGRITFHRLQGAIVIYLSFATIFAAVYSLIWEPSPSPVWSHWNWKTGAGNLSRDRDLASHGGPSHLYRTALVAHCSSHSNRM